MVAPVTGPAPTANHAAAIMIGDIRVFIDYFAFFYFVFLLLLWCRVLPAAIQLATPEICYLLPGVC